MLRNSKTWIAWLLSVVLIVGCFPTGVVALEAEMTTDLYSNNDSSLFDPQKNKTEMGEFVEDISLREENVKHFRRPDGSYEAVVYSYSVHRKDATGKWIDIDNSITEKTVGGVKQYTTPDTRIKFTNSDSNYPRMVLVDEGYSVSVELVGNASSTTKKSIRMNDQILSPVINNSSREETKNFSSIEEAKCIDNKSSIRYEDVRVNTDIEYVLTGNDVKENIILQAKADIYSYDFKLDLLGLIPVLEEGGSISLKDIKNGQTKYFIPVPFMYDSLGTVSYEVEYTLTETSSGDYLLNVSASEEWINSAERVFPVTIDPTIQGTEAVFDTYISSTDKDTNYGESEQVWISSTRTAFILIDPPYSIPEGSTITQATLNIPFYYYSYVTTGSMIVGAYEMLYPWDEYEVTWNIANQNPNLGMATSPFSIASLAAANSNGIDDPGIASLNITSLMQEWIDGKTNYGVALKYISGSNPSVIIRAWDINNSPESYYSITYYPLIDMSLSTDRMGVGGTQQVSYSTYPSGLATTWRSSNTSVATVNSSGLITACGKGFTYITASCYDSASGNTYTDTAYLYVYDSTGIQDNTSYYIMNYSSKRLLSLESASNLNLTNVYTRDRYTTNLSQWTTEQQADGRYKLISNYSSTGKCLDVTENNVDIHADTDGEYLKFTIDRVLIGTYQGLYLIRYGDKYVAQDSDYNVYVTSSRSSAAYWSFMAVEKRSAELFCHDYMYKNGEGNSIHFDTSENYDYFKDVFGALAYSSISYENPTSVNAYNHLWQDDVFVFVGHGGSGRIAFSTDENVVTGRILAHSNMGFSGTAPFYISDLDDNKLSLTRCVLYLGCSTGTDFSNNQGTYNLVDATFEKGAHFVLGTTETLYTSQMNDWLQYFLTALYNGDNIYEALEYANYELGEITVPYDKADGTEGYKEVDGLPIYCVGDQIQYLDID